MTENQMIDRVAQIRSRIFRSQGEAFDRKDFRAMDEAGNDVQALDEALRSWEKLKRVRAFFGDDLDLLWVQVVTDGEREKLLVKSTPPAKRL